MLWLIQGKGALRRAVAAMRRICCMYKPNINARP